MSYPIDDLALDALLTCEIDSPLYKAKQLYRAAIIEECARVAELEGAKHKRIPVSRIAGAIRALKDTGG